MPFQFSALAFKTNTGSPLTKLALIWIMQVVRTDGAPNGMGYVEEQIFALMSFCQCSKDEAMEALRALERMQRIVIVMEPDENCSVFLDVSLPISSLQQAERKRIKASPDQIDKLTVAADYTCPMCGVRSYHNDKWHVDHIIPRSKGGADVEENCQTICGPCNGKKAAKTGWVDFLA